MAIVKEIKKIDMINIMLDNNYPEAWEYVPDFIQRKRTAEECRKWAVNHLQYHVLKEDIYKMFRDYLYWRING